LCVFHLGHACPWRLGPSLGFVLAFPLGFDIAFPLGLAFPLGFGFGHAFPLGFRFGFGLAFPLGLGFGFGLAFPLGFGKEFSGLHRVPCISADLQRVRSANRARAMALQPLADSTGLVEDMTAAKDTDFLTFFKALLANGALIIIVLLQYFGWQVVDLILAEPV